MASFFKQYGAGFFTLIFLIQLCPQVNAQGVVTEYTYSETEDGAARPDDATPVTVTDNAPDLADCEDDQECPAPQILTTTMHGESIETHVTNAATSENPHTVAVSVQLPGIPQNVQAINIIAAIQAAVSNFEQFVGQMIFIPSGPTMIAARTRSLVVTPYLLVESVHSVTSQQVTFNIAPGNLPYQQYTPTGQVTIDLATLLANMVATTSVGVAFTLSHAANQLGNTTPAGGADIVAVVHDMDQLNIQGGDEPVNHVVEEAGVPLDPNSGPNPVTGGVDVPDDEADGNVQSRPEGAPRPDRSNEPQQAQQQNEDNEIPEWDDSQLRDNHHRRDDDDQPPPSAGSGNGPNTPGGGGTYDQGGGNGGNGQSGSTGGNDGGNRGQGGGNQDSLGMLDLEINVNNTRHFVWPDRNDNELNIKRSLWNQVIDQASSVTVEGIK